MKNAIKQRVLAAGVLEEAKKAYYDAWGGHSYEESERIRQLEWKASQAVTRDEAVEIMQLVCPGGYNAFHAGRLQLLPEDCKVTLARAMSVCIYVDRALEEDSRMRADDWHAGRNSTRIWWD